MKNPKVKASFIKDGGTDRLETQTESRENRVAKSVARMGTFTKVTDRLANDSFHMRNHPIPKGKEMFPVEWKMQYVDLFYPYARNAQGDPLPLYIDMPVTTHDIALCERKITAMHAKGLRYTYIKAGEGEWEGVVRLDGGDPDQIKDDKRFGESAQ